MLRKFRGDFYNYVTITGETVEECAAACREKFSSEEYFVGINFYPDFFGSSNYKSMKDTEWSGEAAGKGQITGAGGWCTEELCYSYNEVR